MGGMGFSLAAVVFLICLFLLFVLDNELFDIFGQVKVGKLSDRDKWL